MSLAAFPPAPQRPADAPAKPRRRSRAKPRPPREREVVTAELRGLGGLVLEQALIDATARPLPSLVQWARRLAAELGDAAAVKVETNRELMHAITAINRRSTADPRPIVALTAA
jgi:hypothetical protein